ncbi:MAG: alpha/beta hydrolase [Anaerococcus sp.]|nr:alpha/beta hydrolase [Anaerococcus sp.]
MRYFYREIVKENGLILRGVLNTPEDFDENKKYPVMVSFHGLLDDRNGINYMSIQEAKYLTSGNILVYRFDFSAAGESDGAIFDLTLSRLIEEGRLIYDHVIKDSFVDKENIYLRAHSIGSSAAVSLAYEKNPRGLILYAPVVDFTSKTNTFMKTLEKVNEDKSLVEKSLDLGGMRLSTKILEDGKNLNILDLASKYQGQVIIFRGDRDKLISKDHTKDLTNAFKNASYVELSGTGHNFTSENLRLEMFDRTFRFILGSKK